MKEFIKLLLRLWSRGRHSKRLAYKRELLKWDLSHYSNNDILDYIIESLDKGYRCRGMVYYPDEEIGKASKHLNKAKDILKRKRK